MGKEQVPQNNLELEKRKTFEKMAGFGILAMTTATASCANKVFIVPTIALYAASLRYARKYDQLEQQTSISGNED